MCACQKLEGKLRVFVCFPATVSPAFRVAVTEFKRSLKGTYMFGVNPPETLEAGQELLDWRLQGIEGCDFFLVITEKGELPRTLCVAIGAAVQLKKHILILTPNASPLVDPILGAHVQTGNFRDFADVEGLLSDAVRKATGDSPLPLYEPITTELVGQGVGVASGSELFGPPSAKLPSTHRRRDEED